MKQTMKELRTEEAVGQVLCHDITEIVKDGVKGARFRNGHVIQNEDVPILLSLGKEHVFVGEAKAGMLHEDEAAEILRTLCQNEGMEAHGPREGKIELCAARAGLFVVDKARVDALNDLEDVMLATVPQYFPAQKGQKLAGFRVIPLQVKASVIEEAKRIAGTKPLLSLLPYQIRRVGIVATGSEIYKGRIQDTFTPVVEAKLRAFGVTEFHKRVSDDSLHMTEDKIQELLDVGCEMILCTGGMSVDPDDRTPAAIRAVADKVISYGAPVLPGAMFMLAYHKTIPLLGLPGCVMHDATTIFDIMLPRLLAKQTVTRKDIRSLGVGGLCLGCKVCHYPICFFGKGEGSSC